MTVNRFAEIVRGAWSNELVAIRLTSPRPVPAAPALDHVQEAVVRRPAAGSHLLVVGPPGSGKTTVALEAFLGRAGKEASEPAHVLLVPTRVAAAELKVAASARLLGAGRARRSPAVHTPSAFAFAIVRQFAVARGEPVPSLITGAQQDRILAELLEGHIEGAGAPVRWPGSLPTGVLGIPAFRDELRNFFMRAAEFGLDAEEIAELGRSRGRPEWVMAAALLDEYRNVVALGDMPDERGERYDAARVIGEAATLIENWEQLSPSRPPRVESVVVDDYQEASAALVRLLAALADRGAHLTLLGNPDVAVQTFRGAQPQFVGRATGEAGLGGFGAERVVLPWVYRGTPALHGVVGEAVANVPTAGVASHRGSQLAPDLTAAGADAEARSADKTVAAMKAPSAGAEVALIAQELRQAHLHRGISWDRMAVVVRSGRTQHELRRRLRGFHIPVTPAAAAVVLRDEPAVRMILSAIEAGDVGLTGEQAAELLTGGIGRLDGVGMRRMRREILSRIRNGEFGPDQGIDDALAELLSTSEGAATLPGGLGEAAGRVATVVAAARGALTGGDPSPQTVLWDVWEATGLAEEWRSHALRRGPLGDRADSDLDSVMALFELAESFEVRTAGASAREFVAHVRAEALPSDTLAQLGRREPGVDVLTVAQAAGQEWDLVVVAGVQENAWPDLRLRDSVLGAGELANLQLGRLGIGSAAARREILGDEWRLFASAVSRVRQRLLVTAVDGEDLRPSGFYELVAELAGGETSGAPQPVRRLDLRGLVAELRGLVEQPSEAERESGVAAGLLGLLAELGVPGARPEEWAGLAAASSSEPIYPPDGLVYVSPSRVETAVTCGLRWVLEATGGRAAGKIEQSVGNLIHEIAEQHPHGTRAELRAALEERFDSLEIPEGWIRDRQRESAEEMVDRLAEYIATVPGRVDTEVRVSQRVGDAVISGYVDRLEWVDEGVRVADIKTGTTVPSQEDCKRNPQLGAYQLAVGAGALRTQDGQEVQSVGARLVYVAKGARGPWTRTQEGLPEDGGWAREVLEEALEVMRGTNFVARRGPTCSHCPVKRSCPAHDLGVRSSR